MRVAITKAQSAKKNTPKVTMPFYLARPGCKHKRPVTAATTCRTLPSCVRGHRAGHDSGRLCLVPSSVDNPPLFYDTPPPFPYLHPFHSASIFHCPQYLHISRNLVLLRCLTGWNCCDNIATRQYARYACSYTDYTDLWHIQPRRNHHAKITPLHDI